MKNIIYYVGCCAWMLAIASCSNEMKEVVDTPVTPIAVQTPDGTLKYMEFTASTGANTRTQLTADNDVVWVANDSISIFDGTANRKFTTKDSGASAVFGGEAKSVEAYYALYPYQAGATIENNVIKNVSIPVVQEAKAGSFDGGVNLSVASASTDLQLAFKNVGSLVKFSMSNDKAADVRSVKLTSNDGTAILAGSVNITVGATPTVTATNSQSQVTLKSDNGFEKDKDYYFMVLPGTLTQGFSLTFTDKDNKTWQKTYTAEATMNRSNILRLNDIELGTFTTNLLTNLNLIAAAEASSGQSFTKNADGTVSLLNSANLQIVQSITRLDLSGRGDPTICDEIALFPELEYLDCSYNEIVSLDMSGNLKLKELKCVGTFYNDDGDVVHEGKLNSLNISKNTLLVSLECNENKLTIIDISKNLALETFNCGYNQLSNIDLSFNTALDSLICSHNQLSNLDVSKNLVVKTIYCDSNQLTSLDVTKNTALKTLLCSYNQLTSLDVSKNTVLEGLFCGDNMLSSIDVKNNTALTVLSIVRNQINSIDVSKNTALNHLSCFSNQLSSLDVTLNTALEVLNCRDNQLSTLDLTKNIVLESLICSDNRLTNLDVSKNTALREFRCHRNQLGTLDVSYNTSLRLVSIFAGSQTTASNESIELDLYVNATQNTQTLIEAYNQNVNVLLKSDATHEGYNESNYGG